MTMTSTNNAETKNATTNRMNAAIRTMSGAKDALQYPKKLLRNLTTAQRNLGMAFMAMLCAILPVGNAYAAGGALASSELGQGIKKLLDDLTSYLMWIGPSVAVLVVIYCFIRKAAGDEMDGKKWNSRIVTTIICGIAILGASLIFKMFFGYFGLEAPA